MIDESEAEGQKLGAASRIAINQSAESDLVGDSRAGECFGKDADHDAKHGSAAIEQFSPLELLEMNQLLGAVLKPLIVGW